MTRASDLARLIGAGATINDGTTITTADNTSQLILQSTDADANSGPLLDMKRDSSSPADGDFLGQFNFLGENDASEEITYAQITGRTVDVSDGTEDGRIAIKTMRAGSSRSALDFSSGETVFNDDGDDVDFRVESDGNANMLFVDGGNNMVGIGTNSPQNTLDISFTKDLAYSVDNFTNTANTALRIVNPSTTDNAFACMQFRCGDGADLFFGIEQKTTNAGDFVFGNQNSPDVEMMRIFSDGNVTIGKSSADNSTAGISLFGTAGMSVTRSGATVQVINRLADDGVLVSFRQASGDEGNISVSGSTISYNGFSGLHESSGIATDTPIGTVVSTIDELDVYFAKQGEGEEEEDNPKAGQTRADHAKVKVSDTEGDKAVYGVVGSFNAQGKVNVASVGIGSVRVTGACEKGDLLESNGDGTAKVQSDDIVRSKTIGKVTIGNSSTDVKLVSCVLYCG